VSVITVYAMPAATKVAMTAPVTTARALLATTAHNCRHSAVRRCSGVTSSSTSTGVRGRARRRPRVEVAVALAGLRHPAAINATIARAAIQAEAVVRSVIDTQPDMVTTTTPEVRAPSSRHRWWAIPLVAIAFAALLVILIAAVLPATLRATNPEGDEAGFALVPADAQPVAPRLSFDAVDRFPADGTILFVTVREPQITLLDWFVGEEQDEVRFLSYEDKYGGQTTEQQREISVQMMRSAKETAEYVAFEHLGFPVELVKGDVIIGDLVCLEASEDGATCVDWAPSDDVLDRGDKLREVDGTELTTIDDLSPILARHEPGDRVAVRFERPGVGEQTGEVELIDASDGTGRTIIGFVPFDTSTTEVPFEVAIDSGEIGGPSAGLAFTLTLIDELTPGELIGEDRIAVTGTIQLNGDVGAIGGLVAKTSAVKQTGASVFLVPTAQGEADIAAARAVAGDDLEIIPVANLDEALAALAGLGGNGLELGQPGAGFEPAD
jgi:Lon-like protease